MAIKGRILSVMIPNLQVGGYSEIGIDDYIKFLEAAQAPEEEIDERIRNALEPIKKQITDLGFTEEEADEHLESVIAVEKEGQGREEFITARRAELNLEPLKPEQKEME